MIERLFLNNHLNKNHLCQMPFLMHVYKQVACLERRTGGGVSHSHALSHLHNGIRFALNNLSCISKSFRCNR